MRRYHKICRSTFPPLVVLDAYHVGEDRFDCETHASDAIDRSAAGVKEGQAIFLNRVVLGPTRRQPRLPKHGARLFVTKAVH